MRGRITLIKAAFSNLPVYYMSLFKMPAKIHVKLKNYKETFYGKGAMRRKTTWWDGKMYVDPKQRGVWELRESKKETWH